VDATGRTLDRPVTASWSARGTIGSLTPGSEDGCRATFQAATSPAAGSLEVILREDDREARAEAPVEVLEEGAIRRSSEGIPEPDFIDQPGASWGSRMVDGSWHVNSGHREFRAIADRPALKLRYLAMLFAKEVVLRSHQDPRLERPLEQIVEIASYADRNLSNRGKRRRGTRASRRKTVGEDDG
jgi:hypothetical protein